MLVVAFDTATGGLTGDACDTRSAKLLVLCDAEGRSGTATECSHDSLWNIRHRTRRFRAACDRRIRRAHGRRNRASQNRIPRIKRRRTPTIHRIQRPHRTILRPDRRESRGRILPRKSRRLKRIHLPWKLILRQRDCTRRRTRILRVRIQNLPRWRQRLPIKILHLLHLLLLCRILRCIRVERTAPAHIASLRQQRPLIASGARGIRSHVVRTLRQIRIVGRCQVFFLFVFVLVAIKAGHLLYERIRKPRRTHMNQTPLILACQRIFVALAQEAIVVGVFKIFDLLRIRLGLAIVEFDRPFVLLTALNKQLFPIALRLKRHPRNLDVKRNRNRRRHQKHDQHCKTAFSVFDRPYGHVMHRRPLWAAAPLLRVTPAGSCW